MTDTVVVEGHPDGLGFEKGLSGNSRAWILRASYPLDLSMIEVIARTPEDLEALARMFEGGNYEGETVEIIREDGRVWGVRIPSPEDKTIKQFVPFVLLDEYKAGLQYLPGPISLKELMEFSQSISPPIAEPRAEMRDGEFEGLFDGAVGESLSDAGLGNAALENLTSEEWLAILDLFILKLKALSPQAEERAPPAFRTLLDQLLTPEQVQNFKQVTGHMDRDDLVLILQRIHHLAVNMAEFGLREEFIPQLNLASLIVSLPRSQYLADRLLERSGLAGLEEVVLLWQALPEDIREEMTRQYFSGLIEEEYVDIDTVIQMSDWFVNKRYYRYLGSIHNKLLIERRPDDFGKFIHFCQILLILYDLQARKREDLPSQKIEEWTQLFNAGQQEPLFYGSGMEIYYDEAGRAHSYPRAMISFREVIDHVSLMGLLIPILERIYYKKEELSPFEFAVEDMNPYGGLWTKAQQFQTFQEFLAWLNSHFTTVLGYDPLSERDRFLHDFILDRNLARRILEAALGIILDATAGAEEKPEPESPLGGNREIGWVDIFRSVGSNVEKEWRRPAGPWPQNNLRLYHGFLEGKGIERLLGVVSRGIRGGLATALGDEGLMPSSEDVALAQKLNAVPLVSTSEQPYAAVHWGAGKIVSFFRKDGLKLATKDDIDPYREYFPSPYYYGDDGEVPVKEMLPWSQLNRIFLDAQSFEEGKERLSVLGLMDHVVVILGVNYDQDQLTVRYAAASALDEERRIVRTMPGLVPEFYPMAAMRLVITEVYQENYLSGSFPDGMTRREKILQEAERLAGLKTEFSPEEIAILLSDEVGDADWVIEALQASKRFSLKGSFINDRGKRILRLGFVREGERSFGWDDVTAPLDKKENSQYLSAQEDFEKAKRLRRLPGYSFALLGDLRYQTVSKLAGGEYIDKLHLVADVLGASLYDLTLVLSQKLELYFYDDFLKLSLERDALHFGRQSITLGELQAGLHNLPEWADIGLPLLQHGPKILAATGDNGADAATRAEMRGLGSAQDLPKEVKDLSFMSTETPDYLPPEKFSGAGENLSEIILRAAEKVLGYKPLVSIMGSFAYARDDEGRPLWDMINDFDLRVHVEVEPSQDDGHGNFFYCNSLSLAIQPVLYQALIDAGLRTFWDHDQHWGLLDPAGRKYDISIYVVDRSDLFNTARPDEIGTFQSGEIFNGDLTYLRERVKNLGIKNVTRFAMAKYTGEMSETISSIRDPSNFDVLKPKYLKRLYGLARRRGFKHEEVAWLLTEYQGLEEVFDDQRLRAAYGRAASLGIAGPGEDVLLFDLESAISKKLIELGIIENKDIASMNEVPPSSDENVRPELRKDFDENDFGLFMDMTARVIADTYMRSNQSVEELIAVMTSHAEQERDELDRVLRAEMQGFLTDIARELIEQDMPEAILTWLSQGNFKAAVQVFAGRLQSEIRNHGINAESAAELADPEILQGTLQGVITRVLVLGEAMAAVDTRAISESPGLRAVLGMLSLYKGDMPAFMKLLNSAHAEVLEKKGYPAQLRAPPEILFTVPDETGTVRARMIDVNLFYPLVTGSSGDPAVEGALRRINRDLYAWASESRLMMIYERGIPTWSFRKLIPAMAKRLPYDADRAVTLFRAGAEYQNRDALVIADQRANLDLKEFHGMGLLTGPEVLSAYRHEIARYAVLAELVLRSEYLKGTYLEQDPNLRFPVMTPEGLAGITKFLEYLAQTEAVRQAMKASA